MRDSLLQGFRLGDWLVKPMANKLTGDMGDVHVEPKVMDTLVHLAGNPGEVVSRQQLLESVWQRVVINEETLTRTISELRAALRDSKTRRYIQTVPKRGYLLVEPVVTLGMTDIQLIEQNDSDQIPSIAVMPFVNRSAGGVNEHFADGLTEELLCTLGQIKGLHVAASTSVFSFKGRAVSIESIGRELGVSHLLEGSVRTSGQRARITTQLIRVADGFHVWAASFDFELSDIFAIQDDIAQSVVTALQLKLGLGASPQFVSEPSVNLKAYDYYLKARLLYQHEQRGMAYGGFNEARLAVKHGPDFPEASGLAALIMTMNTISEPYGLNADEIRDYYERALRLDPFQEEALVAKAIAIRWLDWDWAAVKAQFERALAAAPNCPLVITQFAARFYRDLGQYEVARSLLLRAIKLDPINATPRMSLAYILRYNCQFEESLEQADLALRIQPDQGYAQLARISALLSLERFAEAEPLVKAIEAQAEPDSLLALNCRGRFHASAGDVKEARACLDQTIRLSKRRGGGMYLPLSGWIELFLGNIEEGMYWQNLALDQQNSQVLNTRALVNILPHQGMLLHPAVQAFLARMNMDDISLRKLEHRGVLAAP